MKSCLFLLFILPMLTAAALLLIKRAGIRHKTALAALLAAFVCSVFICARLPAAAAIKVFVDYSAILGANRLSGFILVLINLFGFLIALYSTASARVKSSRVYFSYLLALVAFSNLVALSADFITMVFSWGATLALLYALLGAGRSAGKALSIVGFGNFSFLLGAALYIYSSGSAIMPEGLGLALDKPLNWASFILMLAGAFAKAGCMPLHTWVPDVAQEAPIPSMAILPASLDKLLGIYLLARVCTDFFVLNDFALGLLLASGSITIVVAGMMALVQHDLRRLLAFYSISQAGYMVLGFGTGTAIGVAAGLFHMLNNTLYKSGLFLSGGAVAERKNTFDLDKLGGLAKFMPLVFCCALIFSLSISGIPPFNGFVSKWLLYSSVLAGFSSAQGLLLRLIFIFALTAAMFGSILTLASFTKVIYCVFLGQDNSKGTHTVEDAPWSMKLPLVVLSGFCVLLGLVPNLFLKGVFEPWMGRQISFITGWGSVAALMVLSLALFIGFIVLRIQSKKNLRRDSSFMGGEPPDYGPGFPGTEFYKSVEQGFWLKKFYRLVSFEGLDFYNLVNIFFKICAYIVKGIVVALVFPLDLAAGALALLLKKNVRHKNTVSKTA
ncbi:MAG: proton-conducting transporter membrane subunit [Candidatus Omnitrophota bacterium]|nr:proton-conducting transporter membrane subunit [Candidatus Omnitrophota bacterium]